MKKGLLAVLLAVALVAPAFAASTAKKDAKQETKKESKIDVVGKLGLAINPSFSCQMGEYDYTLEGNAKNNFMLGVEGLYKFDEKISAGIGINYMFPSELTSSFDCWWYSEGKRMSLGFINIYATIKPKLSDSIYAIAQIGYGIPNFDFDNAYKNYYGFKADGGIYGGLGAGIEYQSFIFEALYSFNSVKFKDNKSFTTYGEYVLRYSTLSFSVGYKFAI